MGDSGEQDRIDMGTSFERVEFLVDNSNLSWRAPFIKPSVTSLSPLCKILTGNYWPAQEKGPKRRAPACAAHRAAGRPLKRRGGCFSANCPRGGSRGFCPADLWGVPGRRRWREPRGKAPSPRPKGAGGEICQRNDFHHHGCPRGRMTTACEPDSRGGGSALRSGGH